MQAYGYNGIIFNPNYITCLFRISVHASYELTGKSYLWIIQVQQGLATQFRGFQSHHAQGGSLGDFQDHLDFQTFRKRRVILTGVLRKHSKLFGRRRGGKNNMENNGTELVKWRTRTADVVVYISIFSYTSFMTRFYSKKRIRRGAWLILSGFWKAQGTTQSAHICYIHVLFIFWHQGLVLWKASFQTVWGWFWDDDSHIMGLLYFFCIIVSLAHFRSLALDPRGWGLLLRHKANICYKLGVLRTLTQIL